MQTLKPEKRDAIVTAARAHFVEHGVAGAVIADIARAAGVSTGLVYRYFPDKDALYRAAVPREDVARLRRLVLGRARAAGTPGYTALVEALFAFTETHRAQVIIALREELFDALVAALVKIATRHAGPRPNAEVREALLLIYRAHLHNLLVLLADPRRLRARVETYNRYHLAGIRALLDAKGAQARATPAAKAPARPWQRANTSARKKR